MSPIYEKKEILVEIKDVDLTLGNNEILRGVNATIHNIVRPDCIQGQVVCFLGPSGIGKTQLSRVIAGLQPPTHGEVLLNGAVTRRGRVGMVPQTSTLFEFATLRENLAIAARQGGDIGNDSIKVRELLDTFGLREHLDKYPKQLSGGQRQRVAIVRQLVCDHRFILMDEPFSGLDLNMKQKACRMITQAANLNELNTIIVVTHDVTEGMSIADTVWLMARNVDNKGARIVSEYDLASKGLCWRPDILHEPQFQQLVMEVKEKFLEIASN